MILSSQLGFTRSTAFLIILNLLCLPDLCSQNRNLRKTAEQYIENNRYYEAADLLKSYCPTRPKDLEAWYWLAKSQFESNDCEAALQSLHHLEAESKKEDLEFLLLFGRTYHQLHEYAQAIEYYKRFLAVGSKDERFTSVVNEVKRCAAGLRLNYISDEVLVENMGSIVNSRYDDFCPLESPNYPNRIYFSSTRTLRIQDRFADDGQWLESVQGFDTDMFGTEIENGAWVEAEPLNPQLNTAEHEVLQGFSEDGMALIFTRSHLLNDGTFWVDTFSTANEESHGKKWNHSPFLPDEKVRGIYFFNDTTLFFSASRPDGFGGFDLYLSLKRNNQWSPAINLGDQVNSEFDEVTPFMCTDGRTLFFSSNRLSSMGGFDIFTCHFDEKMHQWPSPQNVGRPLNSAGNDLFFRISTDGLMSMFSSDRKSGLGGHDIYSAYFKKPQLANLSASIPPLFLEVRDFQLFNQSVVDMHGESETHLPMDVFDVPFLLYRDDQVVTPQNKTKLEKLIGFLQTYPHLTVEVLCHSDQTSVSNFDLFFSIKRAEQIGSYLQQKGIKPNSIYLRGLGGNYPIALNELNGKDNETGRFYNRRIDFRLHHKDEVPVQVHYQFPELMESLGDERLSKYYEIIDGLSYRIEFVTLDQLYKGDLLSKYSDSIIERNPESRNYQYCSGLFKDFDDALKHLSIIRSEGFQDAKVIPYLNGIRLSGLKMDENLLEQYPDLRNYMLYLN